jgi:hypothetical protein
LATLKIRTHTEIGPLPSIFGLHIATYILCELAGKPITNPLTIRYRRKLYEKLYRDLLRKESNIAGQTIKWVHSFSCTPSVLNLERQHSKLPIDEDDIAMIFEDFHRGRSVMPPRAVPSRPVIVRWDPDQPLVIENCVVMEFGDGEKHIQKCFGERKRPGEVWGDEVKRAVEARAKEIKRMKEWVD